MMKKSLMAVLVVSSAMLLSPQRSVAQFTENSFLIGPTIGLSAWSGLGLGANVEKGILPKGKLGPGVVGLGGRLDYASYGEFGLSYTVIAIGVFGQYHFAIIDDSKWDTYAGLGLGYEHVSWSGSAYFGYSPSGSTVYLAGDAGARYFLSPNMAIRGQIGFGLTLIAFGVDFGI